VIATSELARAVADALAVCAGEPDAIEAEVFAAASRALLARLNYTSHIPCNGVEEPKSTERAGLGVQLVLRSPAGPRIGFGAEPGDLGPDGVRRAIARARRTAVADPDFRGLPRPGVTPPARPAHADPQLSALSDEQLVEAGWRVVDAGIRTFLASSRLGDLVADEAALRRLGLILGGDVGIVQDRVAIVSTAMPDPRTDESSTITASVTAMVEALSAKGTGWSAATRFADFTGEAGADAARAAIAAIGGERVPSGQYAVVFGPQPVADLVSSLVVPGCRADAFHSSSTPFLGRLGQPVAVPALSVCDDGARPGLAASRTITDEGLPTGRTDLIRDGALVGSLANWYEAQRLLHDPALGAKLGVGAPAAASALAARNGFRPSASGGRAFDVAPTVSATNVVVEGAQAVGGDELLRSVGHGLYVGRIWYTYAVNGLSTGDFTCTVVGDSFLIRHGRLAAPLRANAVRINDNIGRVLRSIAAIGKDLRATPVWGADEIVYAPEIAVAGVPVEAISQAMEES
jgi:PmbA protein